MDQSTGSETRACVEELAVRFAATVSIHYHHLKQPGLSRASNAGLRVSDGELIAFTDDDVVVPDDWLACIARAFAKDPEAGLLFGQVKVPTELQATVATGMVVPALTWERSERLHRSTAFKLWGMGANFAVRRTILPTVGGFDEVLGGGAPLCSAQDYDFAYRTYLKGFAILLEPTVMVDHYGTRTEEQWPSTLANYGIGDGAFYAKHVRCGDLRALRMLLSRYCLTMARQVKRQLLAGQLGTDRYARGLVIGVRSAMAFGVDKQFRLYVATEKARLVVTESNQVTATRRGAS